MAHHDIIPPGYKHLNYVISTGQGAWIDTGVSGDDDTLSFECVFYITELANYAGIFGNYTTTGQKAWRLVQGTAVTWMYANADTSNGNVMYVPDNNYLNKILTFRLDKVGSTITDGTITRESAAGAAGGTENTMNIAIGKHAPINPSATVTATYQTWFYGFKIWRGDQLIRDYIPCLRARDNVAGLWDKVNKKFSASDSIYNFGYDT